MANYERAIKRPLGDIKTLVIGIILQMIPGVNLITTGFHLKCAKTAVNDDFNLPEFGEWGKLFITGLIAFLIELVYTLPALIVLFVSMGAAMFGMLTGATAGSNGLAFASLGGMGLGLILGLILTFIAAYISPLALISYALDEKIGDAFKFKALVKKSLNVKYLLVWIVSLAYTLILTGVLSIIPFIGTAAGMFIGLVTSMTLIGEAYKEL